MEINKKNMEALEDQDLEKVSGGTDITLMRCRSCKHEIWWVGNYLDQVFDCPMCGKNTFSGTELKSTR